MDLLPRLVEALMRYELRRHFRRVDWVGPWPPRLPDGPVIAYANHHHYYDGHLGWLLFQEVLGRSATLWMAEWDRFPLFGAVGAQPFPPDAPRRRAATLRRTAQRFREDPSTVLIYYPTGELRPPEDGIPPFSSAALRRLARLYPEAQWWPLALHVTWRGHSAPVALLRGGPPHAPDGDERTRLRRQWTALRHPDPGPTHTLLQGTPSAAEWWSLSWTRSLFERYL